MKIKFYELSKKKKKVGLHFLPQYNQKVKASRNERDILETALPVKNLPMDHVTDSGEAVYAVGEISRKPMWTVTWWVMDS